jgi:hypothetical protein
MTSNKVESSGKASSLSFEAAVLSLEQYVHNTDLLVYVFNKGLQPRQKKKALLYVGIGFVALGIVSILLIYMLVY